MQWLKGCLKVLVALIILGLAVLFALFLIYKPTPIDRPIETTVNGTIRIVIGANPSTGYKWYPELDSQVFELADEGYLPGAARPGAAGAQTFKFKALKAGTYKLHMKYMRPRGNDINREIDFTVIVK